MSKFKGVNQKAKYKALNARLNKYLLLVQHIYDTYNLEASKIATSVNYDSTKPFSFSDYPITKQRVQDLLNGWRADMRAVINTGTAKEWANSNNVQDLLADKALSYYYGQSHGKRFRKYYQTNSDALQAFQTRVDNGMNLSQKIWNQSQNYKSELEASLSVGIQKGMSAVTLSKRVSKYLNDFDKLKHDYKEKYGKEVDCLNCEYRSMRLVRSEINMAYRTAEQERWKQFDFVIGYEIKLSKSHHDRMPEGDICDDLKGKYPKDFKWTGWHPNDMCYSVPILKTEDEFFNDEESENEVTDVPQQYTEWCQKNADRIAIAEKHKTLPDFIKDNMSVSMPSIENYYAPITQSDIDYLVSKNLINPQAAPILLSDTPQVAQKMLADIVIPSIEHSVYDYANIYKNNNAEVNLLLSQIKRLNRHDEVRRAKLLSKLKDVCAEEYKKELEEWGVVDGLSFRKVEKNSTIVRKQTLTTKQGHKVVIEPMYKDVLVYRSNSGIEYSYPIGTRRTEMTFEASKADKIVGTMPKYLRSNIKRISSIDEYNPQDKYWRLEYENPNMNIAATDGGNITFWKPSKGQSPSSFYKLMCHETGHSWDANHKMSSSVLWKECVDKDIALYPHKAMGYPTSYSKVHLREDFAESIKEYLADPIEFKKYFPNRAKFLDDAIIAFPNR